MLQKATKCVVILNAKSVFAFIDIYEYSLVKAPYSNTNDLVAIHLIGDLFISSRRLHFGSGMFKLHINLREMLTRH